MVLKQCSLNIPDPRYYIWIKYMQWSKITAVLLIMSKNFNVDMHSDVYKPQWCEKAKTLLSLSHKVLISVSVECGMLLRFMFAELHIHYLVNIQEWESYVCYIFKQKQKKPKKWFAFWHVPTFLFPTLHQGVKPRTSYLKVSYCSSFLFLGFVFRDLYYIHIFLKKSGQSLLKNHLSIVQIVII